ncbi:DUF222 domain-containing protein [Microlunatus sp. GCM10028923]|uniref:HNH endonuclease n=1 Tax=Microlunatus sp. GCM10028923 TaxID=3273400 RepID=UPI0036232057
MTMTHEGQAVEAPPLSREAAEELADRICAHATRQARDTCELLILIGEFDAGQGWGWSQGFKSVAHWLAWTCSMTQATAREHIRVARALRRMPTVTAAFGAGELSYSKVREVTRVVDVVDEAQLCQLARYATASQLARMISSYRAAAGTRIQAESRRLFRLVARDGDPMTGVTGRLPAEESAIVTAALERARDLNSTPPADDSAQTDPDQHDATPPYTDADAFLDVCRHYLATAVTDDESGEDRSLVIIEVAAEQLALAEVAARVTAREHPVTLGQLATVELDDVPAGTPQPSAAATRTADAGELSPGTGVWPTIISPAVRDGDVPAGTPQPSAAATRTADAGELSPGTGVWPTIISPAVRDGDVPAGTPQPAGILPRIADPGSVSAGMGRRSTIPSPVARNGDVPAGMWRPASEASRISDAGEVSAGVGVRSTIISSVARNGDVPAGTLQPASQASRITEAGEIPRETGVRPMITAPIARGGSVPAGTPQPAGITSRTADPVEVPAATDGRPMITAPISRNGDVPAGTSQPTELASRTSDPEDVPAGTPPGTADRTEKPDSQHPPTPRPGNQESTLRAQVCTVRGAGPIEPQTAQRMICTGSILGAIVDRHGDVLALGRTRRLVSKRQRRALLIRDQLCQFPGCWRDRRLQAHHTVPWSHGGTTDLTNLILLCGAHHTAVHEGGMTIVRRAGAPFLGAHTGDPGWQFLLPGGQPVAESGWRVMPTDRLFRELSTVHPSGPNGHDHPDATTIRTIGGGEGFNLHNCVEALFSMTMDQDHAAA